MLRLAALFFALSSGAALAAECAGTDLLATMPEADRSELLARAAENPFPAGILWRAEKDGRTIHLVGTMHLFDPRHEATLERVTPMIEASGTVFLEMAEGDEARLQQMIAEKPSLAFITEGPTLPDLMAEDDWQALKDAMTERGMPGFMTAKMKPWMAMANLAFSRCDLVNIQAGKTGLDGMIIDRAIALGKPAVALEPIDTAFNIFAEYTLDEQIDMLRLTLLQQMGSATDMSHTTVSAYFREEVQLIWEFSLAQAELTADVSPEELDAQIAKIEELLLTRRNRAWMEPILASDTDDVIAVGALHLPGEDGLLALLEVEGFTITRLPLAP